ncbi:MAG: pilus assembly PilX N-terminal domain-containing protein [Thermodesulfobacteriota bacterium]
MIRDKVFMQINRKFNSKSTSSDIRRNEKGIAVVLALIMLLVMSVLATTISFNSNNNFYAMSNHKQGQEAFLAAEYCVQVGRDRFETIGIEVLYFLLQNQSTYTLGQSGNDDLVLTETLVNGARCRSGDRFYNSTNGPAPMIQIPPITKTVQRPLKNTSLPTSASGGAGLVPVSFVVTGKDQGDKDLNDVDNDINTGTEIAVGFEAFIPGNANQMYSQ